MKIKFSSAYRIWKIAFLQAQFDDISIFFDETIDDLFAFKPAKITKFIFCRLNQAINPNFRPAVFINFNFCRPHTTVSIKKDCRLLDSLLKDPRVKPEDDDHCHCKPKA